MPRAPLRDFFVLTLGLLSIIVALYLFLGFGVDLLLPRMPPDLEERIALTLLAANPADDTDSQKQRYLQVLLDTLQGRCAELPYQLRVRIRPAPHVNALALPGGHIIVFSGLLDAVTSENELAFVLAHQMGHYAHGDHLRGLGRGLVFLALSAVLFGPDSSAGIMLGKTLNVSELTFSRKQEVQADEFALETLYCAYGHVAGASDFYERIPRERTSGRFGHFFSTQPEKRRRIFHLLEFIQSNGFSLAESKPLPKFESEQG
jgi:Zn-dependent protease with chaperone function